MYANGALGVASLLPKERKANQSSGISQGTTICFGEVLGTATGIS